MPLELDELESVLLLELDELELELLLELDELESELLELELVSCFNM